jgi:biopolymer transport protein ExbB
MSFNIVELWHSMGIAAKLVVFVLLLMSIYLVAVSVERYIYFSRKRKIDAGFVMSLRTMLEQSAAGTGFAEVKSMAEKAGVAPIANVAQAAAHAYERRSAVSKGVDLIVGINRAIERTMARETATLKRGLGGLATIASVAPFVGLFGTVVGIINAFSSMAISGSGGLATVSAGIAEALVTTAFGLLVAIPAVAVYNNLTGIVENFTVDMDEVSSELIEAVLLEKKSGA